MPLLWRLSKAYAGSATVLVDELEAAVSQNVVSARWDCVAPLY